MNETDKIKLREFENQFLPDIDNWCRWGKGRDYLPRSWGNPIGSRYQPKNRETESKETKVPIDPNKAWKMEQIIVHNVPELFRKVFVLHYINRTVIKEKMKEFSNNLSGDEKARIIRISRAQYYNRLNRAAAIIARQWDKQ